VDFSHQCVENNFKQHLLKTDLWKVKTVVQCCSDTYVTLQQKDMA